MRMIEQRYDWAFALMPRAVTSHLILHHAAAVKTTAASIHAYHKSLGWAGIAYHYFVSKKGEVIIGRPEGMRGGHTTNWNHCAIGICFEGNFETEQMPEAQKQAGRALVADIRGRHPAIIIGKHLDFGQTACPGKHFPFDEIVKEAEPEPERPETRDEPAPWAAQACIWAVEEGLFQGDGEGNFRWQEAITRQELAVLLQRLSESLS